MFSNSFLLRVPCFCPSEAGLSLSLPSTQGRDLRIRDLMFSSESRGIVLSLVTSFPLPKEISLVMVRLKNTGQGVKLNAESLFDSWYLSRQTFISTLKIMLLLLQ